MLLRGFFAFAITLLLSSPVGAGELRMEMRTQSGSERFVYEPDLIRVSPRDLPRRLLFRGIIGRPKQIGNLATFPVDWIDPQTVFWCS